MQEKSQIQNLKHRSPEFQTSFFNFPEQTIYFCFADEIPYGCFCNFSAHGFKLDNFYWQTSEHYFQAQKFVGTPYFEKVQQAKTPLEAANIGGDRSLPLRPDWRQVKDEFMYKAVLAKFQNHADIRDILLSTGNQLLVETTSHDYYWGCGEDGTGKNRLGQILIEVRTILRHYN
ncbi:NADAR family protein [Nostoc sp. FACHB-973]|uniref:NADAR family protein n=1 Tax=Desmonostoc muscorum LEGE 12446 TaxID=1828758 RepID=A0A8J7A9T0_DESMC|nr:NADAR domain-containing protein [Desmonostoc muscorum]MBD2514762.1 NADAR family protein [Nostoc sp. FACHB-973]MBX9253930.1 NADAR family protein [Desmonostoc muscorum CCALA 125]MCF2148274.1 NADAR domain-containing protein [Desmonostoc muscorum LEGE 12446]